MNHLSRIAVLTAVATLAPLAGLAAPASAATPDEVAGGLVSPLSLAVDGDGTVVVAQNFGGVLTQLGPGSSRKDLVALEGTEVGGVSVVDGVTTFVTTAMGPEPAAGLWTLEPNGEPVQVADLWAYEQEVNPDGGTRYGVKGLDRSCKRKVDAEVKPFLKYDGIVESHPYATLVAGETTYVADAAGNSVLAVTDGEVSTVATLPPVTIDLTKRRAKVMGLPGCAKGSTYKAEGVPTDVELGPDGNLYVTSLPGGPEDPRMGANGGVFRIDLTTGDVTRYAGGLTSPVGLAIGPDGTAYVSMLFASVVMEQEFLQEPTVFAEVPFPGDVELHDGTVYVTETDLMGDPTAPNGRVLAFAPDAG